MQPMQAAVALSARDVWEREQSQLPAELHAAVAEARAECDRQRQQAARVRAMALSFWVSALPQWLVASGEGHVETGSEFATFTAPPRPGLHGLMAVVEWDGIEVCWRLRDWHVNYTNGGQSEAFATLVEALVAAAEYVPADPFDGDDAATNSD